MRVGPGAIVGGKYQLERPLARGGMGAVWVARHVKLGSAVAVKLLDDHLAASPASVARFEREARAAASLDTPHVVHVHDYGVDTGTPYLAMELLKGEDLNARLRGKKRLTLAEAGRILTQIGRALRKAHEAGIVHRDLKPANVFLARVDDDEVVKILDFGIAKETWSRVVEENTKTGEVFGSPHYMSPEQARAQKDLDHRTDLWAAGVITYRMITGRLPFPGDVLGEILSCVLVDPFPPIAEVAPDLPPALDGFFTKALAKKKVERFSTVGEMVEAFNAIVATAPAIPAPRSSGSSLPSGSSPTLDAPSGAWSSAGMQPVSPRDHGAAGATTAVHAHAPALDAALSKPPAPPAPRASAPHAPPKVVVDTVTLPLVRASIPDLPPSAPPTFFPTGAQAGFPAPSSDRTATPTFEPTALSPGMTPPAKPSSVESTGPSIASTTSSLWPPDFRPRRSPLLGVAIGLGALAAAIVAWAVLGHSSSDDGAPAASGATAPVEPPAPTIAIPSGSAAVDPAPTVSALAPADPAPTAGASATSAPSEANTGSSPSASTTAGVRSTKSGPAAPPTSKTTSGPRTSPSGTTSKKPRDWGL